MRNKIVFGMMAAAGCALSVLPSQASITTNVVQSFEALETGSSIAGVTAGGGTWYGSSVIAENSISYDGSTSVGWTLAGGTHAKQLDVAGTVSNKFTAGAANSPVTVDMMVQIALPDDDLDFPSSVTDRDSIQIAVGVATNAASPTTKGDLYAYCKNKSGTVGWYSLGLTLDKDTWHRVSFTFDYSQQLCQIRVDGEPAITSNGYLVNDTTSGYDGSWYKLAASKTQLSSVEVVGSTAIDEMLVTTSSTVAEAAPVIADATGTTPAASTGVAVNNAWIEAQGITRKAVTDNEVAPDETGMTIAQKYAAGFDVADGKKFEILDMDLSGDNAVIKFNSANIPTGYKYVIETSATSDFSSPTTTEVTGSTTGSAALSLEGDVNVKYYRMKLTNE